MNREKQKRRERHREAELNHNQTTFLGFFLLSLSPLSVLLEMVSRGHRAQVSHEIHCAAHLYKHNHVPNIYCCYFNQKKEKEESKKKIHTLTSPPQQNKYALDPGRKHSTTQICITSSILFFTLFSQKCVHVVCELVCCENTALLITCK